MSAANVRRLRDRIARASVNARGRRQYDEVLRRDIVAHASERYACGESYEKIASGLGLPSATLCNWTSKAAGSPSRSRRPVGFRPVTLRAEAPKQPEKRDAEPARGTSRGLEAGDTSRPVVVLPGGTRIEGLAVKDLAQVIRSLGCGA